jgi:hypothetical protein
MLIKSNDASEIRYQKGLIPLLRNGMIVHAFLRARHRIMMLHGLVLCEDGTIQNVENAEYLMPNYSLYIEEQHNGVRLHSVEVLCGIHAHDPEKAWKVLKQYEYFALSDVDAILQDHNFPDAREFDRRLLQGLHHYARYNNLVPRRDFDLQRVELTGYEEGPYIKS